VHLNSSVGRASGLRSCSCAVGTKLFTDHIVCRDELLCFSDWKLSKYIYFRRFDYAI